MRIFSLITVLLNANVVVKLFMFKPIFCFARCADNSVSFVFNTESKIPNKFKIF